MVAGGQWASVRNRAASDRRRSERDFRQRGFRLGNRDQAPARQLPEGAEAADIAGSVAGQGFVELPIGLADAERAGRLPGPHRDPFDRMLTAQALARDLTFVSPDRTFDRYGVRRLW